MPSTHTTMNVTDYCIVTRRNYLELSQAVGLMIGKGWIPHGSALPAGIKDPGQPMVKAGNPAADALIAACNDLTLAAENLRLLGNAMAADEILSHVSLYRQSIPQ